mgnify:CR=1 FL=1
MSMIECEEDILARVSARVGEPVKSHGPAASRVPNPAPGTGVWTLPGIAGPTRVATNFGDVPAHLVRVRDMLRTQEGRYLQVIRIDEYKLDEEFLMQRPEARPVSIGVCGAGGNPRGGAVLLSPAQLVSTRLDLENPMGTRADKLSRQRVSVDSSLGRLSYFVFDLGEPALIRCGGVWVRSACDYM